MPENGKTEYDYEFVQAFRRDARLFEKCGYEARGGKKIHRLSREGGV